MSRLHARWRTAWSAARIGLKDRLAYRLNWTGSMLTYALFVFVFSRIWASTLAGREVAGYDYRMMVWYFIIAEIPLFALGRFFWNLSRDMKSGQVAYLLSRPYDYVSYQFWERFGSAMPDLVLLLLEGLLMGWLLTGTLPVLWPHGGFRWWVPLFVPVSLVLSGTLSFFLQFALSLSALWLEENEAFFWIFQKIALVVGTLLPIEFLPAAARAVAVWTPFPYLAYAPARIMVAASPGGALELLLGQAVWIVAAMSLARILFGIGSRRLAVNGG